MQWPEKPTCHKNRTFMEPCVEAFWKGPEDAPLGRPFRSCSYCGSIHPEDLVDYTEKGARITQADWKYGFPHKFYVDGVPNPRAGEVCEIGSRTKKDGREPIMGPAPDTLLVKWYNDHLLDKGYDSEALELLISQLAASEITFYFDGAKLMFRVDTKESNDA